MADIEPNDLWDGQRSPTTISLEHFSRRRGMTRWDNNKVKSLCEYVGVTLDELCALAGVFHPLSIKHCIRVNKWPVTQVMHFERIRRVVMSVRLKQPLQPTPADIAIAKFLASRQAAGEVPFREVYDPGIEML